MLITYLANHLIEITGLIFGVVYVIAAIYEKWWCWPSGLVAISAYAVSTYTMGLWGEFSLQFFYFFLTVYGWYKWRNNEEDEIFITNSSQKLLYKILVIGLVSTVLFYFILLYLEGTNPFWDALTNGFAIVATYLVAQKKIENWLLWIPIDLILMALMYYRGYHFYSVLYLLYALFAIRGYFEWKKKLAS